MHHFAVAYRRVHRRRVLALMVCLGAMAAPAVRAQGLAGQDAVFSIPTAMIGERGRFSMTMGGAFGTRSGHGNWTFAAIGVNPLRSLHLRVGAGVDARDAIAPIHEQIFAGLRWIPVQIAEPLALSLGAQLDVLRDRAVAAEPPPCTYASGRALVSTHVGPSVSLTGFVGVTGNLSAVAGARGTIWGGGATYRIMRPLTVMAEFSNAVFPLDPATSVALGGVRVFPSSNISLTIGTGRAWRADRTTETLVQLQLGYSAGSVSGESGGDGYLFLPPPVAAQQELLAEPGTIPQATFADFAPNVQADMRITRVVAIGRMTTGTSILSSVDSSAVVKEWTDVATSSDAAARVQITGMESFSTLNDPAGVLARSAVLSAAVAAGVRLDRIILRDQFLSTYGTDQRAVGVFRVAERPAIYTEVARIPVARVAATMDSLSTVLSASSIYAHARISIEASEFDASLLSAAYVVQNMMYRQSLFASYGVEIAFRIGRGTQAGGSSSTIIVEVAP